jgi:signal transduction histidine kinase
MIESDDAIHDSEAQRLSALAAYQILDTPPEASFDRVVAIIAAVFDVPVAMITLVDRDRCWYKARIGMPESQLSRPDNMCDTVIQQDEVYVIHDTHRAPRDLVRPLLKIGMRFYAGAPLRTHDGIKLGTVCAVGDRPRIVTEREKQILADLAAIVIDELELRLAARRMAQSDEALRELNQELAAASRNKSAFLASMSHELRTPLNGILGASELLNDGLFGPLNTKQHEYVRDIYHSGRHLLSLIEEILDLSRIEAGQIDLHREPLDAVHLLEDCVAVIRGLALTKSVLVRVVPPPEPLLFHADERRMKQIICNLLSNAVKFSPRDGKVMCSASRDGDLTVFVVEDNGPGIPPDLQERIFEQFFRIPSDQEGTGLGLPLAKRLVELHGGRIWLDSHIDRGSRFVVAVPSSAPA